MILRWLGLRHFKGKDFRSAISIISDWIRRLQTLDFSGTYSYSLRLEMRGIRVENAQNTTPPAISNADEVGSGMGEACWTLTEKAFAPTLSDPPARLAYRFCCRV